jgi:hypothetical protein
LKILKRYAVVPGDGIVYTGVNTGNAVVFEVVESGITVNVLGGMRWTASLFYSGNLAITNLSTLEVTESVTAPGLYSFDVNGLDSFAISASTPRTKDIIVVLTDTPHRTIISSGGGSGGGAVSSVNGKMGEVVLGASDVGVSVYRDITILPDAWLSDTTYPTFGFRASVTMTGVTGTDYADVTFGLTDATSSNFAPIVETTENALYIYASIQPTADVILPGVVIIKG